MASADSVSLAAAKSAPVAAAEAPSAAAPVNFPVMKPSFPWDRSVTLERLERDPHQLLAELRAREPVSWVPALGGWLITSHELAAAVMRDDRRFTVDDPRFSTAVVVGPSMLSLDGEEHERHRGQFAAPFRPTEVRERFTAFVEQEVQRLIDELAGAGGAELRRSFAGPLAAVTIAHALGVGREEVDELLAWYDQIVAGVNAITAGAEVPAATAEAFAALTDRLQGSGFRTRELVSNAAVLLFGGIETTEGMIANAVLALLRHPDQLARVRAQPQLVDRAVDESLRLEPAAAIVDRYATEEAELAGVRVAAGELVRVSLTGANRDPSVFAEPDRFDLDRPNPRRHLAFAQGPHVCLGIHLARLEARVALVGLLAHFPRLRLDPGRPAEVSGLVFRKPRELFVRWD